MSGISRRALAAVIAASMPMPGAAFAADALKEIHIGRVTSNPVSMIPKQRGLLEKEFAKDGISIVWVQSAGSNKALEFLNAGSIDFGWCARRSTPASVKRTSLIVRPFQAPGADRAGSFVRPRRVGCQSETDHR